jgi:NitT/TauT family transport system ATP-binding protein
VPAEESLHTGDAAPRSTDGKNTEDDVRRMLSLRNLCVSRGSKELFRSFSADFNAGSVTAIIAASGRGKTTLLDCIAGILKPQSGTIALLDTPAAPESAEHAALRVSYLFQEPQLLPWRTIGKNVTLPLQTHDAPQKARGFLAKTGLAARYTAYPAELSGGERQRAAIARAFCFPAPVLLMDEAFQSQDLPLKLNLMQLTKSLLREEARTVILVTHDVREALCLANRILVLTGEPLSIARDIAVPDAKSGGQSMAERYSHLPKELSAIEEDILVALSRDTVL